MMNDTVKLMNVKETANLLQVSIKTVYTWIYLKQIPDSIYRKLGRKPIFIYDEVMKWFLAGAKLNNRHSKNWNDKDNKILH